MLLNIVADPQTYVFFCTSQQVSHRHPYLTGMQHSQQDLKNPVSCKDCSLKPPIFVLKGQASPFLYARRALR
jgi:hypothetical protein